MMTPQEAYEAFEDAYRERMAIVSVEGLSDEEARTMAGMQRMNLERLYLKNADQTYRGAYFELVRKNRGKAEEHALRILAK